MKKQLIREPETVDSQNHAKSEEEQIGQTLRNLHAIMTELFDVDFPFFNKVRVIPHREILKQLTKRIQDDFKKSGLIQSGMERGQIGETLMRNQNAGSFEHFAFYCPAEDTLYMNEKMMTRYPEKVASVCAHELAEKLLSTYASSPAESSLESAVRIYIEAGKTNSTQKLQQLLNAYVDTVFETVLREGCCESIANETLHQSCFAAEAVALDKELRAGYPKCTSLLSSLENARKNWKSAEINQIGNKSLDQIKNMGILRTAQIIKGASYYAGYPLAKLILEKYGVQGLLQAIEHHPPLKTRYFVKPQTYLAMFEKVNHSKIRR